MPVVVNRLKSTKPAGIKLRTRLKKCLQYFVPVRFVRKIMETNFTHFGLEISNACNACNANCSFCAYRFMKRKVAILPQI